MKSFIIVILSLALFSCAKFENHNRKLASESDQHVLFLVHGFTGDKKNFKDLSSILRKNFPQHRIVELEYPSGGHYKNSDKTKPFDFARIINAKIIHYYLTNELPKQTPYSIVGYSMGGLVSMSYINSCLASTVEKNFCPYEDGVRKLRFTGLTEEAIGLESLMTKELERDALLSPPNIKNFVILGSPLWGTSIGNTGNSLSSIVENLDKPVEELRQMGIGDINSTWQRMLLLNRYGHTQDEYRWGVINEWKNPLKEDLKVFNVVGLAKDIKGLGLTEKFVSWFRNSSQLENDLIVEAPQARLDFIYNLESQYPDNQDHFKGMTNMSYAYIPLNMVHNPMLDMPALPVITFENHKKHPVYKLIAKIMESPENAFEEFSITHFTNPEVVDKLKNFSVEYKILTPPHYYRPFKIMPQESEQFNDEQKEYFEDSKIGGEKDKFKLIDRVTGDNRRGMRLDRHYYQSYYYFGKFRADYAYYPYHEDAEQRLRSKLGKYYVSNIFDVPGFGIRNTRLNVLPSFSSFSEVYIKPLLPISLKQSHFENKKSVKKIGRLEGSEVDKVFYLRGNDLLVENASKGTGKNKCHIGMLAKRTPAKIRKSRSFPSNWSDETLWKRFALNKGYLYQSFFESDHDVEASEKRIKRMRFDFKVGSVMEIIGRATFGDTDERWDLGYHCNDLEFYDRGIYTNYQSTLNCDNRDRYLVTSPEIRLKDGVRSIDQISATKGVRWVNVTDVDIVQELPVMTRNHIAIGVTKSSLKVNQCILGKRGKLYYPTSKYFNYYYK